MVRFSIILGVLIQLSSSLAVGQTSNNCLLTIQMKLRNGEFRKVQFSNSVSTKEECAHRARLHSTNFAPREVATKKVSFEWSGR